MSSGKWNEGSYIVQMQCGHLRKFPISSCPYINEEIWCPQCREFRLITESDKGPAEWSARCQECTYARYFGQDKIQAHLRGIEHADRKTHAVDINFGDTFTESYHPTTESIFTTDEQQLNNGPPTTLDRSTA